MTRPRSLPLPLIAAAALAAALAVAPDGDGARETQAAFRVEVPAGMATGRVLLRAQSDDPRVATVVWTVAEFTRRARPPSFDATFDIGEIPHEKPVLAIALDHEGQALYEQEAILNPGERFVSVEILSPFHGQTISGAVTVLVRARVPAGDAIANLTLDAGGGAQPIPGDGEIRSAVVGVPGRTTPVSVVLRTKSGRRAEKTIILNGRGVITSSEAHIVEQVVGVYSGSTPLEGLMKADFRVRDASGPCDIREVKLLRDTPLAVGLLVDTSQSLMHMEALRQATANLFLEKALKERDQAFLTRFGPAVVKVVDWTRDKNALREAVLALSDDALPGTLLYQGVMRALYQFQGSQGARALLLITDGNAYEDEVEESAALAYAKHSAVTIYTLALPSSGVTPTRVREKDDEGKTVDRVVLAPVQQPPNLPVLEKFAVATGGRMYPVKKAEDLPRFYSQIERDIRTQYLVSYVPNAKRTNSFHAVEVKTKKGRVQTSPGFFY